MSGVLVLDLVVPRPEPQRQLRALPLLERPQAGDELLPEAGGRPVLDRVGRTFGDRRVLVAVDAQELVAEEEGGRRAVAALAEILEAQAERGREADQPFEVGRREPEAAAVHGALAGDPLGV